jgi:hypothetical protein
VRWAKDKEGGERLEIEGGAKGWKRYDQLSHMDRLEDSL